MQLLGTLYTFSSTGHIVPLICPFMWGQTGDPPYVAFEDNIWVKTIWYHFHIPIFETKAGHEKNKSSEYNLDVKPYWYHSHTHAICVALLLLLPYSCDILVVPLMTTWEMVCSYYSGLSWRWGDKSFPTYTSSVEDVIATLLCAKGCGDSISVGVRINGRVVHATHPGNAVI